MPDVRIGRRLYPNVHRGFIDHKGMPKTYIHSTPHKFPVSRMRGGWFAHNEDWGELTDAHGKRRIRAHIMSRKPFFPPKTNIPRSSARRIVDLETSLIPSSSSNERPPASSLSDARHILSWHMMHPGGKANRRLNREILREAADLGFDSMLPHHTTGSYNPITGAANPWFKYVIPNSQAKGVLVDPRTGRPFGKADIKIAGRLYRGVSPVFTEDGNSPVLYTHRSRYQFSPDKIYGGWFSSDMFSHRDFGNHAVAGHIMGKNPIVQDYNKLSEQYLNFPRIPRSSQRRILDLYGNASRYYPRGVRSDLDRARFGASVSMQRVDPNRRNNKNILQELASIGIDSWGATTKENPKLVDIATVNPMSRGVLIDPNTGRPFGKSAVDWRKVHRGLLRPDGKPALYTHYSGDRFEPQDMQHGWFARDQLDESKLGHYWLGGNRVRGFINSRKPFFEFGTKLPYSSRRRIADIYGMRGVNRFMGLHNPKPGRIEGGVSSRYIIPGLHLGGEGDYDRMAELYKEIRDTGYDSFVPDDSPKTTRINNIIPFHSKRVLVNPQTGRPFKKADVRIAGRIYTGIDPEFIGSDGSAKTYYHRSSQQFHPARFKGGWFSTDPNTDYGDFRVKANIMGRKPFRVFDSSIPYSDIRQLDRLSGGNLGKTPQERAHRMLGEGMTQMGNPAWDDVIDIGTRLGYDSIIPKTFSSDHIAVPNVRFSSRVIINPRTGKPFGKANVMIAGKLHRGVHPFYVKNALTPQNFYHWNRRGPVFKPQNFKGGWFTSARDGWDGPSRQKLTANIVAKNPMIFRSENVGYGDSKWVRDDFGKLPRNSCGD